MRTSSKVSIPALSVLAFILVSGRIAIGTDSPADSAQAQYLAATRASRHLTNADAVSTLTAIKPTSPTLVWRTRGSVEQVLMVAWSTNDFDNQVGSLHTMRTPFWVTAAPELKSFCEKIHSGQRDLRLQQVLGLPPWLHFSRVVGFWVSPDDLFRPCADPDITTTSCTTAPASHGHFLQVDPGYTTWFKKQMQPRACPDCFPFTGLGYTYDWGDSKNRVGLSEFVIARGAAVEVAFSVLTEEYCRKRPSAPNH